MLIAYRGTFLFLGFLLRLFFIKGILNMITAQQFYQAWLEVIGNNQERIKQHWYSRKDYTQLVIHDNASLIMQVGEKLGLACYNADYYNLDSILYHKEYRLDPEKYKGYYLPHICVAFEHENDFFSGLFQEVTHLLITKSQLRVLVSYPYSFEVKCVNDILDDLHRIIASTPDADDIAKKKSFLLILGHDSEQGSLNSWKGLIFTEGKWRELCAIE